MDYLIVNEDRHQNNFGVIRNAETCRYIGAAPVYDSGTSLWFDKPRTMINGRGKTACKPFKNSHEEQIKLVTSFDWLEFSALEGIGEEFRELVRDSQFIDQTRCDALCKGLNQRIEMLQETASAVKTRIFMDSVRDDVTKDSAYSGER